MSSLMHLKELLIFSLRFGLIKFYDRINRLKVTQVPSNRVIMQTDVYMYESDDVKP
jgi:hypothetical protein